MIDSNRVMEQAEAFLRRVSPEGRRVAQRARERRRRAALRVARRMALATVAVMLAGVLYGFIVAPLGVNGVMIMGLLILISWILLPMLSREAEATPQTLAATDLPLLPQRTDAWLQGQRAALPAPAARLVDGIGVQLEALGVQLNGLDPREPAAVEVRKLIADELPELISGYQRVPAALRKDGRNGMSPDKQLIDGLAVVQSELGRMTEQLASGDLDKLATQGRYLELKYRGENAADR